MTKTIEKYHFKITIAIAVMVIIFIVGTTNEIATWKSNVENELEIVRTGINHVAADYGKFESRISEMEDESITMKVQMATIETKLTNIETLLLDIKQDLKDN